MVLTSTMCKTQRSTCKEKASIYFLKSCLALHSTIALIFCVFFCDLHHCYINVSLIVPMYILKQHLPSEIIS